ncbi:MAG TPA: hypothetical protein VK272_02820 [Solirubrobacteraceae bacterium]|nr:hypothetical protein [Solirubrobacteraceae bacterium]
MSVLGERLLAVHDALTDAGFAHALGGAIALGYCTLEPRGTKDLDVNVFVAPDRVKDVFAALPQPVTVTPLNLEQAERDGQVRVWWEQTPIDIFFDVLPFHREVARNVRQVPFAGRTIPVVGCTALAVFKAMFDRTRDWADIEAMIEAKTLDVEDAVAWIREIAGQDSVEAQKLAALRT